MLYVEGVGRSRRGMAAEEKWKEQARDEVVCEVQIKGLFPIIFVTRILPRIAPLAGIRSSHLRASADRLTVNVSRASR